MKKNWTRDTDKDTGEVDILPLNDLIEHFYGEKCFCLPRTEGKIIMHNSLDKREEMEETIGSTWVC